MKKKSLGIVMLIIILILVLVGYWILQKGKENNSKEEENDKELVTLDVGSDLVTSNYQFLFANFYDSYFYTNKTVTVDNLSEEKKFELAFKRLTTEGITLVDADNMDDYYSVLTISRETMEKALKSALRKEIAYDTTKALGDFYVYTDLGVTESGEFLDNCLDVQCDYFRAFIYRFHFDESKDAFVGEVDYNSIDDPGLLAWKYSTLESATKKGSTLTIVEKVIFIQVSSEINVESDTFSYQVCADVDCENVIETVKNANKDNQYQNIGIDKYMDSANTVTYVFEENEDGTYHFVSSSITK